MRIGIILLILVMSLPIGHALGISPGKRQFDFSPGSNFTVQITIHNNEKNTFTAKVSVNGDLAPYIMLQTDEINFTPDDAKKKINYILQLPEEMDAGTMDAQIKISEKFGPTEGIRPSFTLSSLVVLNIPGKYLTATFDQVNKNISLILDNEGSERIDDIDVSLDIRYPNGSFIDSKDFSDINLDKSAIIYLSYPTISKDGYYNLSATIEYDKRSIKSKQFLIGKDIFDLSSIEIVSYTPELLALDLSIQNKANKDIDGFYASLYLDGVEYPTTKQTLNEGYQKFRIYIEKPQMGLYESNLIIHGPIDEIYNLILNLTPERISVTYPKGSITRSVTTHDYSYVLLITLVMVLIITFIYGKKRLR